MFNCSGFIYMFTYYKHLNHVLSGFLLHLEVA